VKSLVDLWEALLADASRRSGADLARDVETFRARVEHEGSGFITLTLPNFCRDFERSLDAGRIAPGSFASFRKLRSGIPAFLQGLLCNVFDQRGELLAEPSVDCVRLVRQLCLYGKKVLHECAEKRVQAAADRFVQCDNECVFPESQLVRWYRKVADIIVSGLDLSLEGMVPRHGPGATQEGISGNGKWTFQTWHARLEEVGFTRQLFARASQTEPSPEEGYVVPRLVDPGDEAPSRVCFVPKTQRAPRIIAVEPVCMQYAQQGLKAVLVSALEKGRFTSGHVEFRDQRVNQRLALSSSQNGQRATLDMKEASDLVALDHVEWLFRTQPEFLRVALASRSTRSELPDGRVTDLKKFASMGSALCFPVEALVFFVSIVASRLLRAGIFPTERNVYSSGRSVYVYGDDIIVPASEAPEICDDLEALGFRVNRHKSFWTGQFRESCGCDAFRGEEVTPVYLRRDVPQDRKDVSAVLSTVATANQLFSAGYYVAALHLKEKVERCLGPLPEVSLESAAIGWHFHSEVVPRRRWNRRWQRLESRCYTSYQPKQSDPLEGDAALAKCYRVVGKGWISPVDPEHLEMSPRPYALTLKRRWVPA